MAAEMLNVGRAAGPGCTRFNEAAANGRGNLSPVAALRIAVTELQ